MQSHRDTDWRMYYLHAYDLSRSHSYNLIRIKNMKITICLDVKCSKFDKCGSIDLINVFTQKKMLFGY